MTNRIPIERWQRPRSEVLLGDTYKQNEPPFDPFPTITNIINADFCPVAALHDLLYGYDTATTPTNGFGGVGTLYHDFISDIKYAIGKREITPDVPQIMFRFEYFARNEDEKTKRACQLYLETWLTRKLGELNSIKKIGNNFFEVNVANAYVPFKLKERKISYPLRGIIDELDFDKKRLVERTIKGDREDEFPPPQKDFQAWLLWKTLISIEKNQYPEPWKDINFEKFEIIVETPYKDFTIKKENLEFEERVHQAFAWISDIAKERRSTGEAWQYRACTFKNKKECGISYFCYGKRRTYPTSSSDFRQRIGILFRPLFWEQMWEHHLLRYQLAMLSTIELGQYLGKYFSLGNIVNEKVGRQIELKLESSMSPVIERYISGDDICSVIFGSFNLGVEIEAKVTNVDASSSKVYLNLNKREISPLGQVKILFPKTSLIKEAPWFLKRMTQREIHKLEKWSIDDPKRAGGHSVIQMIECLFGRNVLKMEK